MRWKPTAIQADALLLLAAVLWGGGFVAQRIGMQHIEPMSYNAIRFALGAAALMPLIHFRRKMHSPAPPAAGDDAHEPGNAGWRVVRYGVAAGVVLFVAASLQQYGVALTTAGKTGFITGLYVVIVPLMGLVVGQKTRSSTWMGALLAAIGLAFLSLNESLTISRGDALVLACAFGWAVHVLLIAWMAPRTDPVQLACIQFWLIALLSTPIALATETTTPAALARATGAILYGGLGSVGVAYTLQVVGQRYAPPAHAAVILSAEAVFAAFFGWLLLQEGFTARESVGCVLMLGGILVSQVRRGR